ncbi:MAG: inorganic phosphate transporter [Desulfurococcaceae archaeon]
MYIASIVIGAIVVFLIAMINGANDIGKSLGVLSSIRRINTKKMYLLNAIFMCAGALLIGEYISKTYAKGIVNYSFIHDSRRVTLGLLSAMISILLWAWISIAYKIPVSISQLAVGGLLGSGIAICSVECVFWGKVFIIVFSWLITPLVALSISVMLYKLNFLVEHLGRQDAGVKLAFVYVFFAMFTIQYLIYSRIISVFHAINYSALLSSVLTILLYIIVNRLIRRKNMDFNDLFYDYASVTTSFMLSFSYGAHDVGNAAGPFMILLETLYDGALSEVIKMTAATLFSSVAFLIGALIWGYRIAETIGGKIVPLVPVTSFTVQLSTSFTVFILVALGIPSSITLALIGSLAGVGYARGLKYVNTRTLLKINAMWIIGVPSTMLLSCVLTSISTKLF